MENELLPQVGLYIEIHSGYINDPVLLYYFSTCIVLKTKGQNAEPVLQAHSRVTNYTISLHGRAYFSARRE